ncbi:hypothetical protein FEO86_09480 [Stenotrophomonas maltophilia]|nr:hypothetical protein CEE57_00470 [Stenotrophomonas maltophilia]QGL67494.1 hypothetical protein FEO86_09480 [Stenotrophomonas maltophilia]
MYGLGASAGLHPAPAVVPAAGRQLQRRRQKLVSCGMAGGVRLRGTPSPPPPGSGPAAGGCAFGHLRSSASQAKCPHPWGLDGAIHGANGPADPHRPASDNFPRSVGTAFCAGGCRPWSTRQIQAMRG